MVRPFNDWLFLAQNHRTMVPFSASKAATIYLGSTEWWLNYWKSKHLKGHSVPPVCNVFAYQGILSFSWSRPFPNPVTFWHFSHSVTPWFSNTGHSGPLIRQVSRNRKNFKIPWIRKVSRNRKGNLLFFLFQDTFRIQGILTFFLFTARLKWRIWF